MTLQVHIQAKTTEAHILTKIKFILLSSLTNTFVFSLQYPIVFRSLKILGLETAPPRFNTPLCLGV